MKKSPRQSGRREFFRQAAAASILSPAAFSLAAGIFGAVRAARRRGPARNCARLARSLGKEHLSDARNRYCDRETGEEIGWLISPFLNGFYYGYQATHESQWVDSLMDWAGAWIRAG